MRDITKSFTPYYSLNVRGRKRTFLAKSSESIFAPLDARFTRRQVLQLGTAGIACCGATAFTSRSAQAIVFPNWLTIWNAAVVTFEVVKEVILPGAKCLVRGVIETLNLVEREIDQAQAFMDTLARISNGDAAAVQQLFQKRDPALKLTAPNAQDHYRFDDQLQYNRNVINIAPRKSKAGVEVGLRDIQWAINSNFTELSKMSAESLSLWPRIPRITPKARVQSTFPPDVQNDLERANHAYLNADDPQFKLEDIEYHQSLKDDAEKSHRLFCAKRGQKRHMLFIDSNSDN